MDLQQIIRAVVCAALVALCVAGAGLFPAQPVAGQETTPPTLHGAAALDQLKQTGQYDSLQAAMNQARFSVSRMAQTPLGRAAWYAPNPAAGYDAYVTEAGVSIAVNDQSYVSLSLHGFGYGAALRGIAPGNAGGDKQTITLMREGGVREWFVNGADGLEHGFTLNEPPGARQAGVPLRLALQVSAGWRAVAGDDGKRVILRGAGDEVVEYGKLVVRDKLGRNITARMTVADEQIVIETDDHDAEYPLTIDPLFTLQQRLLAADAAAGDYLGYSVALDGNTAVVGAPYNDQTRGAAYVFVRNGATWTQQQKLIAQDGAAQDYFGWSVAVKGNTVVVGALYAPGSFGADQGAAYVFTRSDTTWMQQARLNANENLEGAQFGAAVALDGDTVLVGTPAYTITPSFAVSGAVFIFVRSGTTWAQQARLNANDGEDSDSFGVALALEGDTALIGAPNNAVTVGGQGAAYIFTRTGTVWMQRQRLLPVQPAADDHFGNAVALSGDKALIGAYQRNLGNGVTMIPDCGAVFTFVRGQTDWAQVSQFVAPNPTAGAQFGVSVALSGDTAVVGAARGLFQPGTEQRSAYVFENLGDWELVRQFGPELGSANDGFGYAVALSGETVLVGAYRSDNTATDQGAAYAFVLHDSRHIEQQKLFANDGVAGAYFGTAVALDGDTLAVGAAQDIVNNNLLRGSVYIFVRNGAAWTFQQKLIANDGATGDQFGCAVALSGDTVVVGAFLDDVGGNADQGSAYVFTRSGTVWTQRQKLLTVGIDSLPQDAFGVSVAFDGQTVIVGAYGKENGRGAVYVYTYNGTAWVQQAKLTANDGAQGDNFGRVVALGNDTLAAGAPRAKVGLNTVQGAVYVFTRTGAVWGQQAKVIANDGTFDDYFGGAVALNGDTLAVGALGDKIGANARQGSAYVFFRTGTTWNQLPKLTANDGAAEAYFGSALALGSDTLVVGAPGQTVGASQQQGAAYVFTRLGYFAQQQKLFASDGAATDRFGSAVALSGDTVVVSAPSDNFDSGVDQGSAYVFVSPSCPAIAIAPDGLPNGVSSVAYDQPLTENGGGAGEYVLSVSRGTLPPGLMLSSVPGRLHGTPTLEGMYRFTVTATFVLSGCTGSREYTITILPCPTITVSPAALPNGVVGAAYHQEVTATGGAGQHSFAVTSGALPPGLSLNGAGTLSGTPTQAGSYNFTVTATSINCTGTRAYTLTILATCPTLTVSPPLLPSGRVGVAYNQMLTVMGGVAPYTFAISLGSLLPPGLSFINGVLSGTPTQTGTYGFETRIRDANHCEVWQGYSVTINPPCEPITINPVALPNGIIGEAYNQTLTVTVNTFAAGFAVTAGALPPGLSLSTGGVLNGAPTQTGSYPFTVTATANGCTGTRAYTMIINQGSGGGLTGLQFYPLPRPVRLLDTRVGQTGCDAPGAPISGGTSRTQTAAGRTCDGNLIPASARALTGNITTVQSGGGYLTLYPSGTAQPLVANSNYGPNEILNNVFTVGLGNGDGAFKIFVTSNTHIVVDVTGYYAPPGAGGLYFHPLPHPIRLLETRAGFTGCTAPGVPLAANTDTTQSATGMCDGVMIPATAKAIVGNATSLNSGAGYLTLYPANAMRPLAASSNFSAGQVVNGSFTVGLSAAGGFNVFTTANTDLVIDVLGYYSADASDANGAGLFFTPLSTPVRLLETRAGFTGCYTPNAPLLTSSTRQQQARGQCAGQTIAATALAIVGNATVVNNLAGYLTFWPNGAAQPLVATTNFAAGQILNRHFTVGLGATGMFNIFASAQTDLIIDVGGFFAP